MNRPWSGPSVSRETLERLAAFEALLLKWNRRINLIGRGTLADVWQRHILDSAQLYEMAPAEGQRWYDVGSGGGLPGLVIAILARELDPTRHVSLIESDQRKAAFLRDASVRLELRTTVLAVRIEAARLPPADVISARALAPLPRLVAMTAHLRSENTVHLFPKGRTATSELTAMDADWHSRTHIEKSRTDPEGVILRIDNVRQRA